MSKKESLKIFHGVINTCGIGGHLSQYQKKHGHISDFYTYRDVGFTQNHDINIQVKEYSFIRKIGIVFSFFFFTLWKYDIFHFYSGKTIIPFGLDLPILRLFRKKIIMTYVGTEVRLESIEKKRNPYWSYLQTTKERTYPDWKKKVKILWHNFWIHKFIAPRDMYAPTERYVSKKKIVSDLWIHNMSYELKSKGENEKNNTIPLIIHAPSDKGIKGTKFVLKAVESLKKKNIPFEFLLIENTSHTEALALYKRADIIIDQLLLGTFGSFAVEGMALGKPVVGFILDEIRNTHCPECPIFQTTIDTLEKNLRILIEDSALRAKLGEEGIKFCKKYISKEKIQKNTVKLYKQLVS